jgi:hypothetical protein
MDLFALYVWPASEYWNGVTSAKTKWGTTKLKGSLRVTAIATVGALGGCTSG